MTRIPVVDVFAGPGGLNEGFSASGDGTNFSIAASFEMESNAIETLRLRAATRALNCDGLHPAYEELLAGTRNLDSLRTTEAFAKELERAAAHVHQIVLGEPERARVQSIIGEAIKPSEPWVLIGGPPCQAYSLAGRSRRTHDAAFEDDHKHFLYREYLDILERFRPPVFVMENVKGLLSAGHRGKSMFDLIMSDLSMNGLYEIRSLVVPSTDLQPSDFVIRAEEYGVPQRRHRVILLGLRSDVASARWEPLEKVDRPVTVRQTLVGLDPVQSAASRSTDPARDWAEAYSIAEQLAEAYLARTPRSPRTDSRMPAELKQWLRRNDPPISLHDQARSHMKSDLMRYGFLARVAEHGQFPRVTELPEVLLPAHKNVTQKNVPFVDRFKVQQWDAPSSTITSHISKDGHYYIHPDPEQMRSLTVREAARLQTFPDDYYFCGNRTAQYHQVGNAVPPLLATKIADTVAKILCQ